MSTFVDRRTGRKEANALAEMWRASERKDLERRRRENRALWYAYHCHLHESHSRIAAEHGAKALALLDPLEDGVA